MTKTKQWHDHTPVKARAAKKPKTGPRLPRTKVAVSKLYCNVLGFDLLTEFRDGECYVIFPHGKKHHIDKVREYYADVKLAPRT